MSNDVTLRLIKLEGVGFLCSELPSIFTRLSAPTPHHLAPSENGDCVEGALVEMEVWWC